MPWEAVKTAHGSNNRKEIVGGWQSTPRPGRYLSSGVVQPDIGSIPAQPCQAITGTQIHLPRGLGKILHPETPWGWQSGWQLHTTLTPAATFSSLEVLICCTTEVKVLPNLVTVSQTMFKIIDFDFHGYPTRSRSDPDPNLVDLTDPTWS